MKSLLFIILVMLCSCEQKKEVSQAEADKYLAQLYFSEIQTLCIKGKELKTNFYATKADSLFLEMEKHFKDSDEYFEARKWIKDYKGQVREY